MKRNESGLSRGFGFVKFATAEAAQVAVSANTGIVVRDKVVDVKPHGTPTLQTHANAARHANANANALSGQSVRRDKVADMQMPGDTYYHGNPYSLTESVVTVFVGSLPHNCLDEEFEVAFSLFHPVSCLVKRTDSGQSRGFGFVKFATSEMAQMAVARNGNIIVRDKVVDVKHHGTPPAAARQGKGKMVSFVVFFI